MVAVLLRRGAVLLAAVVSVLLTAVPSAQAHAVLLSSEPAAGYSVPIADHVSLTFTEAVTASRQAIRLTGPDLPAGLLTQATQGGRVLTVQTGRLRPGRYVVRWQVTADDGDVVDGSFVFAVGTAQVGPDAASSGGTGAGAGSVAVTTALRWALFGSLAVCLGGLTGGLVVARLRRLARRVGARELPATAGLPVMAGAIAGAVTALLLALRSAAGGSLASVATHGLSLTALTGPGARLPAVEALLFVAAAGLSRWRAGATGAVIPLFGVAVAEGLRSHLREQDGLAGAAVITVHLALAAAWVGALVVVLRTARSWHSNGRGNAAWQLMGSWSRFALVAYLGVVTTGTLAAVLLLPTARSLVTTGYGQVLLGKLLVVTVVTALAARSRARLRDTDAQLLHGRSWQYRTLPVVLLTAALLVSLSPPRLTALAQQAQPPPVPTGPTVQVGSLAGQLTVGLTVSAGQVRLQVSNPASDDTEAQHFTVSATGGPRGTALGRVPLIPCGTGCFAGPLNTTAPGVTVQVKAGSPGWTGGVATYDVAWPPVMATTDLTRALRMVRTTRRLTVIEQVTSDTSRPAPIAVTLHTTGPELLSAEPYSDPASLQSTVVASTSTGRTIAFAVGGMYFVELTLDGSGRAVAERLTTPNHLIVRTFRYS